MMKPKGFSKNLAIRIRRPRGTNRSAGFSLFELALVLAILVALGSLIVPAINGVLKERQFQRQADEVRILWEQTRLKAMRSGQAQVFRFVVGSGNYSIEPWLQSTDDVEASAGATVMMAGGMATIQNGPMGTTLSAAPMDQVARDSADQLAEGFIFSAGSVLGDTRSLMIAQQTGTVIGGASNSAAPVMFYPDGTTSTAEVALQNETGSRKLIRLRGLTGEVTVVRAIGTTQ
jgi:Tfp pilus assembly protein FimT